MSALHLPAHLRDAVKHPRPFDEAELGVLREFYAAWEAFHKVPKDELHRDKREQAAQAMVGHAHILRRMYA